MKFLTGFLGIVLLCAGSAMSQQEQQVYLMDFEDVTNGVDYSTSMVECINEKEGAYFGVFADRYFSAMYLDKKGRFFTASKLHDLPCSSSSGLETITITGIDISEVTDFLKLNIDVAENTDLFADWDDETFIHIDYQVDEGGYQNGIWFEAREEQGKINDFAAIDNDFDGIGDYGESTRLFSAFKTFSKILHGRGNVLDLRITIGGLVEPGKDIAFDNIQLVNTSETPKMVASTASR